MTMYRTAPNPQPIAVVNGKFLYQLDAPYEEGGVNLWQGNLQVSNGHDPAYAIRAARLFVAAPELLAILKEIVDCPYVIDMATVSSKGLEHTMKTNPKQVVGIMCIALERMKRARAAIAKAEG